MAYQIGFGVVSMYESQDAAERAIEIFLPAGYTYQVEERRLARRLRLPPTFQIMAFNKAGDFVGYCHGWESDE